MTNSDQIDIKINTIENNKNGLFKKILYNTRTPEDQEKLADKMSDKIKTTIINDNMFGQIVTTTRTPQTIISHKSTIYPLFLNQTMSNDIYSNSTFAMSAMASFKTIISKTLEFGAKINRNEYQNFFGRFYGLSDFIILTTCQHQMKQMFSTKSDYFLTPSELCIGYYNYIVFNSFNNQMREMSDKITKLEQQVNCLHQKYGLNQCFD
ncbi:uncharacterized protein LOC128952412 [Oppia nitens]|uniref:uncharacterized protein LOC128952412 n=1 Tax=Oppia nitens TaxID=1686743 RepID=UPI0023DA5D16|nr:uncharacterized protein LOC128952412 [Oppia nitens]